VQGEPATGDNLWMSTINP